MSSKFFHRGGAEFAEFAEFAEGRGALLVRKSLKFRI